MAVLFSMPLGIMISKGFQLEVSSEREKEWTNLIYVVAAQHILCMMA
jgi:hypothetical protein